MNTQIQQIQYLTSNPLYFRNYVHKSCINLLYQRNASFVLKWFPVIDISMQVIYKVEEILIAHLMRTMTTQYAVLLKYVWSNACYSLYAINSWYHMSIDFFQGSSKQSSWLAEVILLGWPTVPEISSEWNSLHHQ